MLSHGEQCQMVLVHWKWQSGEKTILIPFSHQHHQNRCLLMSGGNICFSCKRGLLIQLEEFEPIVWVSISHYAVCNLEVGWPAVLDCLELRTSQHAEFLVLKLGQLVTLCTVPKLPCSWYLLYPSSLKPSTSLRSVPVPSQPISSSSLSTFLLKWMDWANWSQTLRYKSMWSVSFFPLMKLSQRKPKRTWPFFSLNSRHCPLKQWLPILKNVYEI